MSKKLSIDATDEQKARLVGELAKLNVGPEEYKKLWEAHHAHFCEWDRPWQSACGADRKPESIATTAIVQNGKTIWLCAEHATKRCVVCGMQAVLGCDATLMLVCGFPLCSTCDHHPRGDHRIAEATHG